jgi:hypothetical protein
VLSTERNWSDKGNSPEASLLLRHGAQLRLRPRARDQRRRRAYVPP